MNNFRLSVLVSVRVNKKDEWQLMISKKISKQTLIGGTAAALLLVASISTASAQQRHGMTGTVSGNQSVGANVGANGAGGTAQAQLSEGSRTKGNIRDSAAMNGSRGNSARFSQRADVRGGRDVDTTYGARVYGRSVGVDRDRVGYGAQYARSGYAQGYDRDWRYRGAGYATMSSSFGYSPDYAYAGYGRPYYDHAPGYASAGYYDYAPGFGVGVGFTPTYGGCTCAR